MTKLIQIVGITVTAMFGILVIVVVVCMAVLQILFPVFAGVGFYLFYTVDPVADPAMHSVGFGLVLSGLVGALAWLR